MRSKDKRKEEENCKDKDKYKEQDKDKDKKEGGICKGEEKYKEQDKDKKEEMNSGLSGQADPEHASPILSISAALRVAFLRRGCRHLTFKVLSRSRKLLKENRKSLVGIPIFLLVYI